MRHVVAVLLLLIILPGMACAQALWPEQAHPRQAEALAAAEHWLDLFEARDDAASFAQLTEIFQQDLTPEIWREAVDGAHARLGKLISRKLRRIVWYQDPEDAPLPGTYAAVEFDSVYEKAALHFGFVILHSLSGEPFRIMRHESNHADIDDANAGPDSAD